MHRVLVRLQRADGADELRHHRVGGCSVFVVCERTHMLLDLLNLRGVVDAIVEGIDGHRLRAGQARVNPVHDPHWFVHDQRRYTPSRRQ